MSSPMSSSSGPPSTGPPRKSALKGDDDGDKTSSPAGGSMKAVQIAEPAQTPPVDEAQFKKQYPAGIGRRLSGRPPVSSNASKSSIMSQNNIENLSSMISTASSASASAADDAGAAQPEHRHRINRMSEKLLAQVADWLEHEKAKKSKRKPKKASPRRKSPTSGTPVEKEVTVEPKRSRAGSIDSESSDVSFDRLQRILDDSMTALGLSSVPRFSPRLGRRYRKSLRSFSMGRTASSDTEFFDGDALVPSCDAFLDNSKATSYQGGKAAADDDTPSSNKDDKENQGWAIFKNDIIRIAHTLKLKGWRRVPLDSGNRISVQRLSGALTNAVYVVSPPEDMAPGTEGQKPPAKVLLRLYGPHVDIDRDNELSVLRRLARKKIGPRLLGTFQNGRFEQFFNATTLTPTVMRDPDTSRQIAKRMRELHDGIELLEEERDAGPAVWKNWDRWVDEVERSVTVLDKQILKATQDGSIKSTGDPWMRHGFLCGVEWPVFKAMVVRYRKYLDDFYGGPGSVRDRLVFSHNDTQYGNILRVRPENKMSPLLQPANEHKQLIVIDFEYAGANVPGLEFANHFTEWTYNYHDEAASFACNPTAYPTPEQQFRFAKAYVDHRPQYPHASATPTVSPLLTPLSSASASTPQGHSSVSGAVASAAAAAAAAGTTPVLHRAGSTSSIIEFMLDARAPAAATGGTWTSEDARREEESERRAAELMDEARLWRVASSAFWIAWGIVQAKVLPDEGDCGGDSPAAVVEDGNEEGEAEEGFDYLSYAQERAFFFWGDCVLAGLAKAEELPLALRERIKLVQY